MLFWARVRRWCRVSVLSIKRWFRPAPGLSNSLAQRGFINPDQLKEALRIQQMSRQPFDKILISLGMVGEREVYQAKAQEMGFAFVDLDRVPLDAAALDSISPDLARTFNALPVKRIDNQLWVAMSNPQDIRAIDELSTASKCRIIPVLAVPDAIESAIHQHYPVA